MAERGARIQSSDLWLHLVEHRRFELLTSSMRSSGTTSLAYVQTRSMSLSTGRRHGEFRLLLYFCAVRNQCGNRGRGLADARRSWRWAPAPDWADCIEEPFHPCERSSYSSTSLPGG